jgi:hypothetical protein
MAAMERDTRRLVIVILCIAGGILLIYGLWLLGEVRRPELVEARVVSASTSDPVFREGVRTLEPGEAAELAVALRLHWPGRGDRWLAPVDQLQLDGAPVEHVQADSWPERDRSARVFWFTVESNRLGGELSADTAAERLAYKRFLVADAGRGLRIPAPVEPRNDEFLADTALPPAYPAGTLRFSARVEVVASMTQVKPLQAADAPGIEALGLGAGSSGTPDTAARPTPALPTLVRPLSLAERLSPAAGELLNLPGFEPAEGADPEQVTVPGLGRPFSDLVAARLVSSSWAFAAMNVAGTTELDQSRLRDLGMLQVRPDSIGTRRGPVRWGTTVQPGDLLELDGHWMVLLHDDGDGVLDRDDVVAHCWHRPAELRPLSDLLGEEAGALRHLRHGPGAT